MSPAGAGASTSSTPTWYSSRWPASPRPRARRTTLPAPAGAGRPAPSERDDQRRAHVRQGADLVERGGGVAVHVPQLERLAAVRVEAHLHAAHVELAPSEQRADVADDARLVLVAQHQ